MSNKSRGLGRGLGDLLADNAPELRSSSVIRKDERGEVSISPIEQSPAATVRGADGDNADAATERPLVFPQVTPIVGGRAQADEAREILEADAALSGRSIEVISASSGTSDAEGNSRSGAEQGEDTVVYPRSLKAVFRNFK